MKRFRIYIKINIKYSKAILKPFYLIILIVYTLVLFIQMYRINFIQKFALNWVEFASE